MVCMAKCVLFFFEMKVLVVFFDTFNANFTERIW